MLHSFMNSLLNSFFFFLQFSDVGGGFGIGSRSATTSPTGSVHSTPTHQTKPNNLDPFADIGNLSGSLGGLTPKICLTFFVTFYTGQFTTIYVFTLRCFWILQQAHYSNRHNSFLPTNGFPVAAAAVPPAHRRLADPHGSQLLLLAAQCRRWRRLASPRTGSDCPTKAQPQPHLHSSHIASESTQLQR